MKFVNLTPHAIKLNSGETFEPSGVVARVATTFTTPNEHGICRTIYGDPQGIPDPEPDTMFIVSSMLLGATDRPDLVAPATSHPDVVRNEKGHIVSVPCFTQ